MPKTEEALVLHLPVVGVAASIEDGEAHYVLMVRTPSDEIEYIEVSRGTYLSTAISFLKMLGEGGNEEPAGSPPPPPEPPPPPDIGPPDLARDDDADADHPEADEDGFPPHDPGTADR